MKQPRFVPGFVPRFVLASLASVLATLSFVPGAAAQDIISTAVGAGPNGIPAVDANLNQPQQLAVDKAGNYYFSTYYRSTTTQHRRRHRRTRLQRRRRQSHCGRITSPQGVAIDSAGDVYISDTQNCLVRKVIAATGIITTIAGLVNHPSTGNPYPSCGYSGDGGAADAAQLNAPIGLSPTHPTTTSTSPNTITAGFAK